MERQLQMFSLRPGAELDQLVAAHAAAPERRIAQRALADEVTALVHGLDAAVAAAGAADVLFGGDPLAASPVTLEALAGELPVVTVPSARPQAPEGAVALLVSTGLASSNSDARRLLQQGSVQANGLVLGVDGALDGVPLLHGRWMLLRRGKRSFGLVEFLPHAG